MTAELVAAAIVTAMALCGWAAAVVIVAALDERGRHER